MPRYNVVEFDRNYRRDVIVRIRVVGVGRTKRRAGEKQHQAEDHAAKILMTEQRLS
jgi:hypothetical protein